MGKVKRIDLFLLHYTLLLAGSLILVWVMAAFFIAFSGFGTLYPANASEKYLSEHSGELEQADVVTEKMILPFNQYAVYDDSGNYLYGNADDSNHLWNQYKNGDFHLENALYLKEIKRSQEVLLISYPIKMMYKNDWLRNHFPNPEVVLIVFTITLSILVVFFLVKRYAVRLSEAIGMINAGVQEINLNNLDFEIQGTEFKELNAITQSLELMKKELRSSLEQSWEEQEKREFQIKALGHDFKTPLTIIKGNAELLTEMNFNQEVQSMLEEIILNTHHLSDYALSLRNLDTKKQSEIEDIDIRTILNEIQQDARTLSSLNGKNLKWNNQLQPHEAIVLRCERNKLKRALMNVIINAVERSTENVSVSTVTNNRIIEFSVLDDGHGFSDESLKRATEAFFTDDPSRHKKRRGLGLSFAHSVICEDLGGVMNIENIIKDPDKQVLGACVKCRIPLQD